MVSPAGEPASVAAATTAGSSFFAGVFSFCLSTFGAGGESFGAAFFVGAVLTLVSAAAMLVFAGAGVSFGFPGDSFLLEVATFVLFAGASLETVVDSDDGASLLLLPRFRSVDRLAPAWRGP